MRGVNRFIQEVRRVRAVKRQAAQARPLQKNRAAQTRLFKKS